MCALRHTSADLIEMMLHGLGIGIGHDESHAFVPACADRAEDVCRVIALIGGLARTRALLRPLIDTLVLLADTRLVLKPNLDRGAGRPIR